MKYGDTGVTDQQRELCAVSVMRCMLGDLSVRTGIPFEDLFFQFVKSPVYEMLFDYDTRLWAEGPDYLCDMFESFKEE